MERPALKKTNSATSGKVDVRQMIRSAKSEIMGKSKDKSDKSDKSDKQLDITVGSTACATVTTSL
jgi:hypothetical protein